MVGWHHQLNGHEFEQAPEDGEGQGSLGSCSPWGRKELDTTEQLNNNKEIKYQHRRIILKVYYIVSNVGKKWKQLDNHQDENG